MDFSEPIYLPDPELAISGVSSASPVIGVWEEDVLDYKTLAGPLRLTIEQAADGDEFIGTLTLTCNSQNSYLGLCQEEPPPIATDPNADYPPDWYWSQIPMFSPHGDLYTYFPYRIFDASFDGSRFSFWTTHNDLWRDWCALQTVYPITNGSRKEYSCLPDPKPSPYGPQSEPSLDPLDPQPPPYAKELLCFLDNSVCRCDA
jgi:hypothetical protein